MITTASLPSEISKCIFSQFLMACISRQDLFLVDAKNGYICSSAFNSIYSGFSVVYVPAIAIDLSPLPKGLPPVNLELWQV